MRMLVHLVVLIFLALAHASPRGCDCIFDNDLGEVNSSIFPGNRKLDFPECVFWEGIFTAILQVRFPRECFWDGIFTAISQRKYIILNVVTN